jgi:AcrR family transcriptional regulator
MTNTEKLDQITRAPTRADARRNYDKLVAAARESFADEGTDVSLESIAKRAGVGIGTLYRHFPTRQSLFEGVYVSEVRALCDSVDELTKYDAWVALTEWLKRFVEYAHTKKALAQELVDSFGNKSGVFAECRAVIYPTGEPLLKRAQDAGLARKDLNFDDVLKLLSGMTMIPFNNDEQMERVLNAALDGIRVR